MTGGFLRRVRSAPEKLEIEAVPQAKRGMQIQIASIPEAGGKQEILYRLGFTGNCGESYTIPVDRAVFKNLQSSVEHLK